MIHERELRIGNLIETNIIQPVELETFQYLLNSNFAPHDAIKPIPFTEDWLKKISAHQHSFELGKDGIAWFGAYKNKVFLNIKNCADMDSSVISFQIKYVHQAQNIYHSLTGEELTIKENVPL